MSSIHDEGEASGAPKDIGKKMRTLLRFIGYFPLENQLMENWSGLVDCDLEKIFDAAKAVNDPKDRRENDEQPVNDSDSYTELRNVFQAENLAVNFPIDQAKLCRFESVDQFLSHPALADLDALAPVSEIPAVRILAGATVRALSGLRATPVEGPFAENGINHLLQCSYNRIIACLQKAHEAVCRRNRIIEFTDELRLIYEELTNVLVIASPFVHSDFEDAMRKKMAFILDVLPSNISSVRLKNEQIQLVSAKRHWRGRWCGLQGA